MGKRKETTPTNHKSGKKKRKGGRGGGEQSTLKAHARNHTQEVKTEQSLQALIISPLALMFDSWNSDSFSKGRF